MCYKVDVLETVHPISCYPSVSLKNLMSNLNTQFQAAVAASKTIPSRPDNETLLKLYSLYKQASVGDVQGKRPGMFSPVDRAKYDAWSSLKGVSADSAKEKYIALIERLKTF